jgi:hypothetical protein
MKEYLPRDDKKNELICRLLMFAIYYAIAFVFNDGLTFIEGVLLWLFTGSHYDTTTILNNQRHQELKE